MHASSRSLPTRLTSVVGLAATVWLAACTRGGMRYPGPVRHLGKAPDQGYAERMEAPRAEAVADRTTDEATSKRSVRERDRKGGAEVARAAGELVGQRRMTGGGETHRFDCSGMVEAAYARAGWDYNGGSKDLYALAKEGTLLHKKKRPYLGDIVFWDNTYDRNRNGRRDDTLTHVGVVEAVLDDDTIRVVHLGSKGVVRIAMNLHHPGERYDGHGDIINSYVRSSRDKGSGGVLAGELFRGFGSLWRLPKSGGVAADWSGCIRPDSEA